MNTFILLYKAFDVFINKIEMAHWTHAAQCFCWWYFIKSKSQIQYFLVLQNYLSLLVGNYWLLKAQFWKLLNYMSVIEADFYVWICSKYLYIFYSPSFCIYQKHKLLLTQFTSPTDIFLLAKTAMYAAIYRNKIFANTFEEFADTF